MAIGIGMRKFRFRICFYQQLTYKIPIESKGTWEKAQE